MWAEKGILAPMEFCLLGDHAPGPGRVMSVVGERSPGGKLTEHVVDRRACPREQARAHIFLPLIL